MLSTRALKGFIFGFLLVLAGGLVYIGSTPLVLANPGSGVMTVIGLISIFFGLLIALVACGL